MFEQNERQELRQFFFDVWRKYKVKAILQPLEAQVLQLMLQHPEYHELFEQPEKNLVQDYQQNNPFLHLSLHQALQEQVHTNRPQGITELYKQLSTHYQDAHTAEHQMMEVLAETLWESMAQKKAPDEQQYILRLKRLLQRKYR